MIQTLVMSLHEGMCFALMYGCFCRAVLTNADTWRPMRHGIALLALCACLAAGAPILSPGWHPDQYILILEAGISTSMTISSFYWRRGVPPQYQIRPAAEPLEKFHRVCADAERGGWLS